MLASVRSTPLFARKRREKERERKKNSFFCVRIALSLSIVFLITQPSNIRLPLFTLSLSQHIDSLTLVLFFSPSSPCEFHLHLSLFSLHHFLTTPATPNETLPPTFVTDLLAFPFSHYFSSFALSCVAAAAAQ